MKDNKLHSYSFHQDSNQYPSQSDFDDIVQDYLDNLSFKKRDKALIDRQRYNLILQVLQEPKNTSVSTAQFRFWVKKMFQLVSMHTGRLVVCHDNKPVAVREQIYIILHWAHRQSHHGGRDKTSTLVRQRFSWIPKELIARFVRHCPFCITRRNGQTEMFSTYSTLQPRPFPLTFSYKNQPPNQPAPVLTSLYQSPLSSIAPSPPSTHDESNMSAKTRSFSPAQESEIRNGMLSSPVSAVSDDAINPSSSTSSTSSSSSTRMEYVSKPPTTSHLSMYQFNLPVAFSTMDCPHSMRHAPLESYDFMNSVGPTARPQSSFLSDNCDYGAKPMQSMPFVNESSLGLMPFF